MAEGVIMPDAGMQARVTAVWIDLCKANGANVHHNTLDRLGYELLASDNHTWLDMHKTTSTNDSRRWFCMIFSRLQKQDPGVASAKKPAHDDHTWSDVKNIWRDLNGAIWTEEDREARASLWAFERLTIREPVNSRAKYDESTKLLSAAGTDLLRSLPVDVDAVLTTPVPSMEGDA